jgi:hypothetical protein
MAFLARLYRRVFRRKPKRAGDSSIYPMF